MTRHHLIRHWLSNASKNSLTIFQYHKIPAIAPSYIHGEVEAAAFSRMLSNYLAWFQFLPLEEAIERQRRGDLPQRAAAMTFDDGYAEWFDHLVPLLKEHGLPATFFITSNQLGKSEPFWHERIANAVAVRAPGRLPEGYDWGRQEIGTRDAEIATTIAVIQERLKYKSLAEREEAMLCLEEGISKNPLFRPFTAADVIRLRDAGFQIGGHSRNHPILSRCSGHEALDEIGGCKEDLEAILKQPVTQFAYPNGRPGSDFNAEHIKIVRQAGYRLAVTTAPGVARVGSDSYQLPRFTPWAKSDWRSALQIARNMRVEAKTIPISGQPSGSMEPLVVSSALRNQPQMIPKNSESASLTAYKSVLMIAFHFPPQAGSSGILRTLNFAKYLPANAWKPTVLSANRRAYEECRDDLLKSIPKETRVIRSFALDAARHLGIMRKYPSILALPDRWSTWWFSGVLTGLREIRKEKPDVIWSTYPITSAHLIGATLARRTGLPWVADFRDPMINGDYPAEPLQRKTWQWLEGLVMRTATRCVFTTERAAEVYRARYPSAADKCRVIENGYDEEAFTDNEPQRYGIGDDHILMLHSGIIYPRDRDPSAFFAAITALIDTGKLERKRLRIRFRAPHHGDEVAALATQYKLDDVVEIAPPIPYREAIGEMLGADLLLVFQGSHFNSQIPAKIYEYLRTEKQLMGLIDPSGDTASQLRKFDGVALADISDLGAISEAIDNWLQSRKDPENLASRKNNAILVKRYSRASHTERLATLMGEIS